MTDEAVTVNPVRQITAVILAGGMARRMNGEDKGLIELNGQTMIERIITALEPQVEAILINANRNLERYSEYGYPVIQDRPGGQLGPLAGVASGMQVTDTPYLLSVPCDSPFIPPTLVDVLFRAMQVNAADIAVAHDGVRMQQAFSLVRRELLPNLLYYLEHGGRKVETWFTQHTFALADFSQWPDAFLNLNTPEDKAVLEQKMIQLGSAGLTDRLQQ